MYSPAVRWLGSALMLVAARLRYLSGKKWGLERYINMKTFGELD